LQHLFIISALLFSPDLSHGLPWPLSIVSKGGLANDFLDPVFYLIFSGRRNLATL
jgi:hypothetical protein